MDSSFKLHSGNSCGDVRWRENEKDEENVVQIYMEIQLKNMSYVQKIPHWTKSMQLLLEFKINISLLKNR